MNETDPRDRPIPEDLPRPPKDTAQHGEDTLDEALEESFPVSDPPAVHPQHRRD
ncbi:hypothetical protein [Deinococcus sp.]|uniref:hypothetical protein n=1 Tax=Deinococcus sp. TaxID=47478 RepID=UPI00391A62A3